MNAAQPRPDSDAPPGPARLRIALAQLSSGPNPASNLAAAAGMIARAGAAGAQLVALPEATMASFGTRLAPIVEFLDGPFAQGVRMAAARAGVVAVVGMFTPAGDGRVHNTLLATGPGVETHYDKIHLFDAFGSRESATVAPGGELATFDMAGTTVGLATCYDLRFAGQFTALGRRSADLVVVPASWADGPGKTEQWDLLTRARAMDAQAYLAACDQAWVPPHDGLALGVGRSRVADPYGRTVDALGPEPGLLVVDVDLGTVQRARRELPILGERPAAGAATP